MSKIIFSSLIFLTTAISVAGDKVGNGGGLWTCSSNKQLTQGMLVDLYEAEEEFSLELISSYELDPMKIVKERYDFINNNLPQYFYQWDQKLIESLKKIHFVKSELTIVDDSLYRVKPLSSTCSEGWVYTQFANFTNQDQILIREDLWANQLITSVHKAALVWHEVIYAWLREQFQDKDSIRARQIVGIIFSKLSASEMGRKIDNVLNSRSHQPNQPYWFCMIKNNFTFKYFSSYGLNQLEASTKAIQKCNENGPSNYNCDEYNIKCDQILNQNTQITCRLQNLLTNKSYLSKGLISLEAEYKVRELCQNDGIAVHCDHPVECE